MRKYVIPLGFAATGWAFCGAIMGTGPALTSMRNTLNAHAVAGPPAAVYQKN